MAFLDEISYRQTIKSEFDCQCYDKPHVSASELMHGIDVAIIAPAAGENLFLIAG
jgi:hypothetical protein